MIHSLTQLRGLSATQQVNVTKLSRSALIRRNVHPQVNANRFIIQAIFVEILPMLLLPLIILIIHKKFASIRLRLRELSLMQLVTV